jgi:hypothetical protein
MTLDSAIVSKDFGNPSIVRARPINVQLAADGSINQSEVNNESAESEKKTGGAIMLVGFALIAYVVYNILKND